MRKLLQFRRYLCLPYAPIVAAPLILAFPILLGGALYFGTPSLQFVPWRAWAWDVLLKGSLPLWNPLLGMGAPLAANYQTAFFYPPNWVLMAVHGIGGTSAHAWTQTLLVAAHWIWAGLGAAALARQMKLNPPAQAVAGLAFGLSSYLVTRAGFLSINAAVAWLPWVILFTNRVASDVPGPRPGFQKAWIGLAVCLTLQLLAGHAQLTWYTLLLAWLWFAVAALRNQEKSIWQRLGQMALGCCLAFGLAAVQLIPTAEYLLQSQRSSEVLYERAMTYSFWPWRLITLLAPDFFGNPSQGNYWHNVYFWEDAVYIGLLPIVLGFATGLVSVVSRLRFPRARIPEPGFMAVSLFAVGCISFLLAMGRYLPVYPFLYQNIPTFDMFQAPTRFSIWAVFAFAMLAGIAVHQWRRPQGKGLYWTRLGTAGAFAVMVGAGLSWKLLDDVQPTFIRAAALAGLWGVGFGILALLAPKAGDLKPTPRWNWAVAGWVALDILVAGWGLNPAVPVSFYAPETAAGASIRGHLDGHRLFLPARDEYALKFDRFFPIETFNIEEDPIQLRKVLLPNLTMLNGISSANNFDPLVPARYERWMTFLSTRTPDELKAWLGWMDVGLLEQIDPESKDGVQFVPVRPDGRFRWSYCAEFVPSEAEAWEAVIRRNPMGAAEIGGPVVIENSSQEADPACEEGFPGEAVVIEESPNRVVLSTRSDRPGWLVQADLWYPGWTAKIDGENAPLYRADYLFRGIFVPAGNHKLTIAYQPISFYTGLVITVLSGLCLIVIIINRKVVKDSRIG
jgi:hypothetical protein